MNVVRCPEPLGSGTDPGMSPARDSSSHGQMRARFGPLAALAILRVQRVDVLAAVARRRRGRRRRIGPGVRMRRVLRLRDRYTKMLAHVAARFASDAGVVGFEIYNEPLTEDAVLAGVYAPMIAAVRAAAPTKLVFLEPSVNRNQSDSAPVGAGSMGGGTVYAPHVYTLAFTSAPSTVAKGDLRPSNAAARAEADGFAAPLAITEHGWTPASPVFSSHVRYQQELQDEFLSSGFFWLWSELSQDRWGFSLGGAFAAYDATCDGAGVAGEGTEPLTFRCGGAARTCS